LTKLFFIKHIKAFLVGFFPTVRHKISLKSDVFLPRKKPIITFNVFALIKTYQMMITHDEELQEYFK